LLSTNIPNWFPIRKLLNNKSPAIIINFTFPPK
jgi:hypothetical protein